MGAFRPTTERSIWASQASERGRKALVWRKLLEHLCFLIGALASQCGILGERRPGAVRAMRGARSHGRRAAAACPTGEQRDRAGQGPCHPSAPPHTLPWHAVEASGAPPCTEAPDRARGTPW